MGYLCPLVSGVLLALSFPKADISILAWAALAPLLYSIRDKTPLSAFREGFAAGLVFYTASVYWVIIAMHNYGGVGFSLSALLLVALSAYLALYFGLFAWLMNAVYKNCKGCALLAAPAFWVSLELLRNYFLTGFPWNLLGYSQHADLRVIQVSDIAGVYGVSALIVLINAAFADIITLWVKRERPVLKRLAGPAAALLLLVLAIAYGQYRLANPPRPSGSLKVALVQGNIDQSKKWDPAFQQEVFDTYKGLTLEAASEKPDLIVWPETATPFYFQDRKKRAEVEGVARAAGTYLMTGSPSFEVIGDDKYLDFNSAYLLSPKGEAVGRYDKMHLVPFGEYVPLKRLLPFVSKMVTSIGDFGTGKSYTVMDAGKGSFGTAICFEMIFPELVRRFPLAGADFLASITNDAWYERSAAPYQHFNMGVFRAVENRRALIRAANTGISGIILPTGEVAAKTGIFTRLYITGEIPLVRELTFYTRYGDVFAYACVLISAVLLVIAFRRRKI